MTRTPLAMLTFATALAGVAAMAVAADPDEMCRTVRFLKDGSVVESTARLDSFPGGAAASASASGGSSARSSASASTSSTGGKRSAASASSMIDSEGRTITVTRDDSGCTVTIDERAAPGE